MATKTDAEAIYLFADLPPSIFQVEFVVPTGFGIAPLGDGSDPENDSDAVVEFVGTPPTKFDDEHRVQRERRRSQYFVNRLKGAGGSPSSRPCGGNSVDAPNRW